MFLLSETAFTVKVACVGSIEITLNLGQISHNTNWIQRLYLYSIQLYWGYLQYGPNRKYVEKHSWLLELHIADKKKRCSDSKQPRSILKVSHLKVNIAGENVFFFVFVCSLSQKERRYCDMSTLTASLWLNNQKKLLYLIK